METEFSNYQQVERYVHGEMSKQEQQAFEQQLQTDAQLKKVYADFLLVDNAVKVHSEVALQQKWQRAQAHWQQKEAQVKAETKVIDLVPARLRPLTTIYRFSQRVASILLPIGLILGCMSFYLDQQTPKDQYVQFPIPGTMGSDESAEGFLLYKEGKYELALAALETIPSNSPNYPEAQLLQGEILFQQKENYAAAFTKFDQLLNQPTILAQRNQDFKERLEWNTVLADITLSKQSPKKAALFDQLLTRPQHKFHRNAIQLDAQLKRPVYLKWAAIIAILLSGLAFFVWWGLSKKIKPNS